MGLFLETVIMVAIIVIAHVAIYMWIRKKPQKSIKDRHVVITGGSSGIGFWTAIHCVKFGAHVTIIARNVKNLEVALSRIQAHRINDKQLIQYRSLDLSESYDTVEQSLSDLEKEIGPIFALINCAGGATCGTVDEMPIDEVKRMMDINYFATYFPTRYALSKMKKTGDGIITITGSQASLLGIYGFGAYASAKFALRGLAETIAMEVSNTKISVTLALPADTDTPGFANENLSKPKETKIISNGGGLAKPVDIADKILNDSLCGNFISISGAESWLLTIICSGMSPWGGIGFTLIQSLILGPLRLVAYGIQWHCRNVVKTCAAERNAAMQSVKKDN